MQLKALHFFDWTTIFGAELLWPALPFIIVLSSLANTRIDDDLSRHIGLNARAAHIVETLFRNTPSHAVVPIVTGLLFSFAGIAAVVASLQVVYERFFEQEHRGWRDLPRYVVWAVVVVGLLTAEGIIDHPERRAAGPVIQALLTFVIATIFFFWTCTSCWTAGCPGAVSSGQLSSPRSSESLSLSSPRSTSPRQSLTTARRTGRSASSSPS
jgi:hypothetical protein